MVEAARGVLGGPGKATEVAGGVEWKSDGGETILQVQIGMLGENTRIRVEVTRVATGALSYWMPTAASVVVTGTILGATDPHPTGLFSLAMVAASAVGLGLGRLIFVAASRAWEERTRRLIAAVSCAANESSDPAR